MTAESFAMREDVTRREFVQKAGIVAASVLLSRLGGCGGRAYSQRGKQTVDELYREKYRPQFHFTAQKNWINDPNGLVYYKGEYHLFFQHNPFGIKWGNMTWGHAVSKDLIHWQQLPNAIEPDELGTIFSGSAVVDWKNTSGFQTGKENVLVAFYTSAGKHAPVPRPFTQSIAYSNDRGRTWVKYENNPVIGHIRAENRDPKVIWHEPTQMWIMALYLDADDFLLLSSKDIRNWTPLQEIKLTGSDECPDFFELPVDGDAGNTRWVFWGGDGKYMLGTFDGRKFTPETDAIQSKVGYFSAAQTWSDIPSSDGRRIQIGWTKGDFPGMGFNQQFSIPCELSLRTFDEGIRLCRVPVREIEKLRVERYSMPPATLELGRGVLSGISGELLEVRSEIDLGDTEEVVFVLRGTPVVYFAKDKALFCRDRKAELRPVNNRIKLHILVDRTCIEIFANEGRASMFLSFPLDTNDTSVELFARWGRARVERLDIWKLKSIWT
ncbi:MAG TPA: glycoside hydrolase family 32 protein [Sedimentisphaerales bacterium]|nr:glycoside hydrolase family 32 protein [Sedimentisphaerales bacterium]